MPLHRLGNGALQDDGRLRYRPPTLVDPLTIRLSNTPTGRRAMMDPNRDYIVDGRGVTLTQDSGIELNGGRNVVARNLEVFFATDLGEDHGTLRRGLFVKGHPDQGQARTLHVEGLRVSGYPREGIDIDSQGEPGLSVQICNAAFPDPILGSESGNHSDVIQTWNGPTNLRVDRLYARYGYQGFFLNPHQFAHPEKPNVFTPLGLYEFSRVYLEGTADSGAAGYMVADGNGARPEIATREFWVRPSPSKAWPGEVLLTNSSWWGQGVRLAPNGRTSFVSSKPGKSYVSPGYA
jgi:hypothetical protein